MSKINEIKRNTIRDIILLKKQRPVVCLTAYSAPLATIVDQYTDLILVGDSLGMVVYGMENTLPVTLDMMIHHGKSVVTATSKSLIVIDMPFGSYQESQERAFNSAATLMKSTGCGAVKLEGGSELSETVSFLVKRGLPVMGHIGLQPQSVNSSGGYRVTGKSAVEKEKIIADAITLEEAGAFAIVLECMDTDVAKLVTSSISIPTIGIGASDFCDGQILVTEDMLGLSSGQPPKFVKPYANLNVQIEKAVDKYAKDVKARKFPAYEHTYNTAEKSRIKSVS